MRDDFSTRTYRAMVRSRKAADVVTIANFEVAHQTLNLMVSKFSLVAFQQGTQSFHFG